MHVTGAATAASGDSPAAKHSADHSAAACGEPKRGLRSRQLASAQAILRGTKGRVGMCEFTPLGAKPSGPLPRVPRPGALLGVASKRWCPPLPSTDDSCMALKRGVARTKYVAGGLS